MQKELEVEHVCHSINRYAKAYNKHIRGYNKNKEMSYLKVWDVNNLYGWAMSQKLPASDSMWVEDISKFFWKLYKKL